LLSFDDRAMMHRGAKSHRKKLWRRKATRNFPNPQQMQHSSLLSKIFLGEKADNFSSCGYSS